MGSATFTVDVSMNAMPPPRMVAANIHLPGDLPVEAMRPPSYRA